MGGTIRSVSVYPLPQKVAAIRDMADTVTRITQLPTYVGDQGGVHRLVFTSLAKASGWRDLLVPVVLGGLIIFATMLGSVSDREREIYTFSSLGLAPPHVASLFFAEASMYAVIGGMGGYLLGQVVARGLAWMSGTFGWSVPSDELQLHQRHRDHPDRHGHGADLDDLPGHQGLAVGQPGHPANLADPQAQGQPVRPGLPVHRVDLRHHRRGELPEGALRELHRHVAGRVRDDFLRHLPPAGQRHAGLPGHGGPGAVRPGRQPAASRCSASPATSRASTRSASSSTDSAVLRATGSAAIACSSTTCASNCSSGGHSRRR